MVEERDICFNCDSIAVETLEWVFNWEFISSPNWIAMLVESSEDKRTSHQNFKSFFGYLLNSKVVTVDTKSMIIVSFDREETDIPFYQNPQSYIYSAEGFNALLKLMHNMGFISSHNKPSYRNFWSWEFNHVDGYHGKQEDINFYSACYRSAIQAISEKVKYLKMEKTNE